MEKNEMWAVVGITIVVTLAVSFLFGMITGGKEPQLAPVYGSGMTVYTKAEIDNALGNVPTKGEVYTKSDIDARVRNFTTNQGVLSMLSKCQMYSLDSVCSYLNGTVVCDSHSIFGIIPMDVNRRIKANTLCSKIGGTCNIAMIRYGANREFTELSSCNLDNDPVTLRFSCC